MIYLLLGEDDFSKQSFLKSLIKPGVDVQTRDAANLPSAEELSGSDLFGGRKLWILRQCIDALDREAWLAKVASSQHDIVLVEESLDRRKTTSKQWLSDKRISLKEFGVPEGSELSKWTTEHAKSLDIAWSPDLTQYLLARLGYDQDNRFGEGTKPDLWQLHNELLKIKTYCGGEKPDHSAIDLLVPENRDAHVFAVLDALASGRKQEVINLLSDYFSSHDSTDEKAKAIQLTAALAEQFRSILLVLAAGAERMPDQTLLSQTGWKSGRLFIVRRNASRFNQSKVTDVLQKLAYLDVELKSTARQRASFSI